jgi:hypothetical protein
LVTHYRATEDKILEDYLKNAVDLLTIFTDKKLILENEKNSGITYALKWIKGNYIQNLN